MLNNRTALITGASRGIGRAIARLFSENGCNIIINYNNSENEAVELENEIKNKQIQVKLVKCDISDNNQVKDMFRTIQKEFGKLDILVNNAGFMQPSMILMTTENLWQKTMGINLDGSFYCLQQAAKMMIKCRKGKIINISSIVGKTGDYGNIAYATSKSAIIGLTKCASKELASFGINVNAIAPGFIDTDLIKKCTEEYKSKIESNILLGRIGTPDDIAKTALFLASDLSDYISGEIIGVDGDMVW
jgi:3-oxoacyl-[acyl-carrier protein] reductase